MRRGYDVTCSGFCGWATSLIPDHDTVEPIAAKRDRTFHPQRGRRWTAEDRGYVMRMKDTMSAAEIAESLGRTRHSVYQLLSKASIRKKRLAGFTEVPEIAEEAPARPWQWTAQTVAEMEDAARPGSAVILAARLGRSRYAIWHKASRLGISLRSADGMLSLQEVSRGYRCTEERVMRLIRLGHLRAEKSGRFWRIDPIDAERVSRLLRARSKHDPRGRK